MCPLEMERLPSRFYRARVHCQLAQWRMQTRSRWTVGHLHKSSHHISLFILTLNTEYALRAEDCSPGQSSLGPPPDYEAVVTEDRATLPDYTATLGLDTP